MNVQYLSVLTTVNAGQKTDYTVVKSQDDNFKSFIMDDANFKNADRDNDEFLTYSELSDIKLSPIFNAPKNEFEFRRGFGLLSQNSIKHILDEDGLSLKLLEESLKEFDKNRDNKITSNEINPILTDIVDTQQKDYRALRMQNIHKNISNNAQHSNDSKQIQALNKQIESLKKMLQSFKTQQVTTPTTSKNDVKDISTTGINKKLATDALENKYGKKDTNKLISTISRTPYATKHITSVMYQSGTKASEKEVSALAGLMESSALNKIAVTEVRDMNAIAQLSPASTPVNIDAKNIDLSIANIEAKILDLEGMKGEILEKQSEKTAENIYH